MHLLRRLGNRYEPPMHLVLGLRKIGSNDSKMLISAGRLNTGIIRERHSEWSTTPEISPEACWRLCRQDDAAWVGIFTLRQASSRALTGLRPIALGDAS